MAFAIAVGGKVVAVSERAADAITIPNGMPVAPGWDHNGTRFIAPPYGPPWVERVSDTVPVECCTVAFPFAFPPGVNVTIVDGLTARVQTPAGLVDTRAGDVVIRVKPDVDAAARTRLGVVAVRDVLVVPEADVGTRIQ